MALVVAKFGGTSVATAAARATVVLRVAEFHARGDQVVVVVSAMGREESPYSTDSLLRLASSEISSLAPRELDAIAACGEDLSAAVLASECIARGLPAISLRGYQAGIVTDGVHQDARIQRIDAEPIRERLAAGRIVVVTGFQGVSPGGDITTLGRGGSDTSAVALGVALGADEVIIYSDVEGVFSADPRHVSAAQLIPELPYREAAEMAYGGARVLHPRAAELAERYGIVVRICSTFSRSPGTVLRPSRKDAREGLDRREDRLARAVTSLSGICQFSIVSDAFVRRGDAICGLLETLAENCISLDMINVLPDRLVFTISRAKTQAALALVQDAGYQPVVRDACAKVTVVGGGIHGVPGVMARIARVLAANGVPILQSVDSSMLISVLVADEHEHLAVRVLHAGFLEGLPG